MCGVGGDLWWLELKCMGGGCVCVGGVSVVVGVKGGRWRGHV